MSEELDLTPPEDDFEREERCRKTIKSLLKAILIRLFAAGLILWGFLQAPLTPLFLGLMALSLLLILAGILPLWKELAKQRQILRSICESND